MEKAAISSAAPAGTQGAHATRGSAAKPGAARESDQAAGLADVFAQLLAAMGQNAGADASLLEPAPTAVAGEADEPMSPASLADPSALLPWMAGLQPTTELLQPPQPPRSLQSVKPLQALGTTLDLGVDALAGSAALDLVYLGRDSLVGQTAMLDGAAEAAALNGTAQGDGAATPMGRARAGHAPLQGAGLAQGAADSARGPAQLRTAGAQPAQAAADQVATQALANGQAAGQGASASGMERANPLQAVVQPQMRADAEQAAFAVAAGGLEASAVTAAPVKPGAAPAPEGSAYAQERPAQQGSDGVSPDAVQVAQGGADELLADQLAEQVTYWVQQKTQNAELTLDQGGRPVEVKVALTGEQAHVSLRSDQLEARQLLDAGRDQLQDMLQRQGLQLVGMTVGSGSGDGARQGGREPGRQGAQRANVQAAASVGAPAQRGQGVGERSVDIFV